jgi:hypothetical protein
VRQTRRHEAEVAGLEELGDLLPLAVLHVDPHLALDDVEGLVGVVVPVCGDELALGRLAREDPELPLGLVTGQQHRERVAEELRVLALAALEEERLGGARQDALPLWALLGVDQVLEAHAFLPVRSATTPLKHR